MDFVLRICTFLSRKLKGRCGETIFLLLVFQVTLHFLVRYTLSVFVFPFVRVMDLLDSFGFFALASALAPVKKVVRQSAKTSTCAIAFFTFFIVLHSFHFIYCNKDTPHGTMN